MEALFDMLQSFYDNFPLSLKTVLVCFAAFMLAFALAFREFWAWYTKMSSVRKELRDVRKQLTRIEERLESLAGGSPAVATTSETSNTEVTANSTTPEESQAQPKKKAFPVVH